MKFISLLDLKKGKKLLFLNLILIISVNQMFSQHVVTEAEINLTRKANNKFIFAEYNKALPLYEKLLIFDSTSYLYNFRLGVCYLRSNRKIQKSIKYLENAMHYKDDTDGATFEFYYYLGLVYQNLNEFDKAIEMYTIANTFRDTDSIVNIAIRQCYNGIKFKTESTNAIVSLLNGEVNSIYPDYSPVVLPNKGALVITSTRKSDLDIRGNVEKGGYYEDMYISIKNDKKTEDSESENLPLFDKSKSIGSLINSNVDDASITTSSDGRYLYFYSKNKAYKSKILKNSFGVPIIYNNSVVLKNRFEGSMSFNADGKTIYFVSSRSGGYGGKDIYRTSKKEDGSWGLAYNLGANNKYFGG